MNLNNIKAIKKNDNCFVSESIKLLPEQIKDINKNLKKEKIFKKFKNINKIVINGMGGSNLGARIIRSVFAEKIKIPIIIIPGYGVPKFIDKNTLYIISSYSGTTEEPLSVYNEIKKRKAKIALLTSNNKKSKLKNLIEKGEYGYIFNPSKNLSQQPRLGIAYSVFGMIILLSQINILKISQKEIKNLIKFLEEKNNYLSLETKTTKNKAKQFAQKIYKKTPILIGAEFLTGNLHTLRNQFCENSKNFAEYLTLPELNHYAMEGLSYPITNKKNLIFIFFDSNFYHQRIQKRNELTKKVVKKNKIQILEIKLNGQNKLEQSFEVLQFGSWLTYYLGALNKVNPAKIPWVNWFKKRLA